MSKPRSPRARAATSRAKDEIVSTVKRMLPVDIDEKVTRKKEHRIAKALTEKKEQQELMNAEILPRRKAIKELESEIETLRSQVIKGTEDREVVCDVIKDFAHMKIVVRRRDTREVVEDRTMTDEDRQEDLLSGKGKKGKRSPADEGMAAEDAAAADPGDEPPQDDDTEVH